MLNWSAFPFLRILLFFVCGILLAKYTNLRVFEVLTIPYLIFAWLAVCAIKAFIPKSYASILCGHLLLVIICLLGYVEGNFLRTSRQSTSIQTTQAYLGTIGSFPVSKEKFWVYELDVTKVIEELQYQPRSYRVLLYQKKTDTIDYVPRYGDLILVEGSAHRIPSTKNPYTFDFSAYMAERNIFFQHFTEASRIQLKANNQASRLLSFAYILRAYFEHKIETQIHGKEEQSVVKALLLGIKGQLNTTTKGAYAAAGAMHILAVSGLHVSVIYFIIHWILSQLSIPAIRRVISPPLYITSLWSYALLTGFSPSILRAVTMFTVLILAQTFNRRTNIFNSLAFTAFVLLLFQPRFLFDVGFQLSFLAVAGIVYFHPKISSLWTPRFWLGNKVWQLTSVSLAAQLSTFPLSLYYFHQFPSYFLISNLVVIPLAFVIMVLGIVLICFGHWFGFVGLLLENSVHLVNSFVLEIREWYGSVIDHIVLSSNQVWAIYIMILALSALIRLKKSKYMYLVILAAAVIAFLQSLKLVEQFKKRQLVFYSTRKSLTVDKITGLKAQLVSAGSPLDAESIDYMISPFRDHCLLPPVVNIGSFGQKLADFASLEVFAQYKILRLHRPFSPDLFQSAMKCHLVVISNQSVKSIKELMCSVNFDLVILDTSNGYTYRKRLIEEGEKLNLEIIDLNERYHLVPLSGY